MIHLHFHTCYSDGFSTPELLEEVCAENNIKTVAITDHHNLHCHYKWNMYGFKNIKIIYGCEVSLLGNKYHITVLPINKNGYIFLVDLLKNKTITLDMLYDNEDIIVLSGCAKNIFVNSDEGEILFEVARRRIKHFYAEIVPYPNTEFSTHKILEYAHKYSVPLVFTNDAHFCKPEHHVHVNILQALKYNIKFNNRKFEMDKESYLMSEADYVRKLTKYNLVHHFDICNLQRIDDITDGFELPQIRNLEISSMGDYNIADYVYNNIDRSRLHKQEHHDNLAEELRIIEEKGLLSYFAIVHDIVKYAKDNNRIVGGRGSAAGSVLSYALHITNVDPIKYKLRFDRFIDPTRVEYPDIDLDFSSNFADDVRNYVINKYGKDNVAALYAYIKCSPKSLVNDIARLADIKLNTKFDKDLALGIVSNDIKSKSPYFKYVEDFEKYEIIRHSSKHAAGVVLGDSVGLYADGLDKYDCEKLGLIKLDLLARSQLNVLESLQSDNKVCTLTPNENMYKKIHDNMAYSICDQCDGTSVIKVLQAIKPTTLAELSNVIALARAPSLLQKQDKEYALRKKPGYKPTNEVDKWLMEKFPEQLGILIYQEQILDILKTYGKFDPYELMTARKAISKTTIDLAVRWKQLDALFPKFAANAPFNKNFIDTLWKKIRDAALYSFNMAHSISYAYNAETMMMYKANDPIHFYNEAIKQYGNTFFSRLGNKTNLMQIRKLICEAIKFDVKFKLLDSDMINSFINNEPREPHILDDTIILPIYAKSSLKNIDKRSMYFFSCNKYDLFKYYPYFEMDTINKLINKGYNFKSLNEFALGENYVVYGMLAETKVTKFHYAETTLFTKNDYINIRIESPGVIAKAISLEKSYSPIIGEIKYLGVRYGKLIKLAGLENYAKTIL